MISPYIREALALIKNTRPPQVYDESGEGTIVINALTGKAGAFYEKIRSLVDYKDEHTLRRNAIARILRRKILIEGQQDCAEDLLQELISGGYLPNEMVRHEAVALVQASIDKYLSLTSLIPLKRKTLLLFAAYEIEHLFAPQVVDDAFARACFETVAPQVTFVGKNFPQEIHQTIIYAAVWSRLIRADKEDIVAAIVRWHLPDLYSLSATELQAQANTFLRAYERAKWVIEDKTYLRLAAKLKNYGVYFTVLREIAMIYGGDAEYIFTDPKRLQEEVTKIISEKFTEQYEKAKKSGVRAVWYILITKTVIALSVELPYEYFVLKNIALTPLLINVFFHPLLLLFIVRGIREPSDDDVAAIVRGVSQMLAPEPRVAPIKVRAGSLGIGALLVYILFYWTLFVITFGLILSVLSLLHFNIVSTALFIFFLTLVTYFGFRIRYLAERWRVRSSEKEGITVLLFDFLAMPVVQTGRWLSEQFAAINIFIFILDFIIETPFKLLLSSFNSFVSFLKEQRDSMM